VFGGGQKSNESNKDGVLRETMEEGKINLSEKDVEYIMTIRGEMNFFIYETAENIAPILNDEHIEARWVNVVDVTKYKLHHPLFSYWKSVTGSTPYPRNRKPFDGKRSRIGWRWIQSPNADMTLSISVDNKTIGSVSMTNGGVLHSLSIDEPYRNRGYGTLLVKKLMAGVKIPDRLYIGEDVKTGRVIHFFERFGFQQVVDESWKMISMEYRK
jgi:ribosomal protein S18 acetylase RimI-like enzyme